MGFNDAMSGYKKLKNDKNETTKTLLEKLKGTEFSFGSPSIGTVAKKEAIVFDPIDNMLVYITVKPKAIEIGRTFAAGLGKNLLKELSLSAFTDANSKEHAQADRAVEEIYSVLLGLEKTGVVENKSSASVNETLYMQQKILSIKDKYSICTADETPVYWVAGNLLGLNYAITDTNDQVLMDIKKKPIAIMPTYSILKNGKVLGVISKKMKLTKPEISGKYDGSTITIKGDLSGFHFSVAYDDVIIGNVDTERLTWGDVYSIEIVDTEKRDLMVTIATIVDNAISN